MATETQNLIQWLLDLLNDDAAKEDFLRNPDEYLREHGYADVSAGDIYDSLCLIHDGDYDGSRGDNDDDDDDNHHPAPHRHDDDDDDDGAHYLREYITNNYTYVDDRDTEIDNSIHQDIDTDGGDFDQTIDNDTVVASGDGATAVGGDNNGNISSAGGDNTTAFGDGDATNADFDGAEFGSGSAVNVGDGSSNGNAEVNTNLTVEDSFRAEDNDNVSVEDNDNVSVSDNDSEVDNHSSTHNDVNSHNDTDVDAV